MIGPAGYRFLKHALEAFRRLLPHTALEDWRVADVRKPGARWVDSSRRAIRVQVRIRGSGKEFGLESEVMRLQPKQHRDQSRRTLDYREKDICNRISLRVSSVLRITHPQDEASLAAILAGFDEDIVAEHIKAAYKLRLDLSPALRALHTLAEQTYENRSLAFGCVIDGAKRNAPLPGVEFPASFLGKKRFRVLSDGYRTVYHVSSAGALIAFLDIEEKANPPGGAKHWFPQWAGPLAGFCCKKRVGLALTRQGDILVFADSTLRYAYRAGRWQYWNHSHIVDVLRSLCRVQKVPPAAVGRLVGLVYKTALDVSFKRTGGLFLILRRRRNLHELVRHGDAIGDEKRGPFERELDAALGEHMPRSVVAELAALDGAVVVDNAQSILAYGAVLSPHKKGRTVGTEGARSKAAIGASLYGTAVKVSSDGDITVYYNGEDVLRV